MDPQEPTPTPEPRSKRIIRWIDYGAMAVLAGVVVYRFILPHPGKPVPPPSPGHAAAHVATHGKPVLVDLSSTV